MILGNEINISDLEEVNTIEWHINNAHKSIQEVNGYEWLGIDERNSTLEIIEKWIPCLKKYLDKDDYICGFYDGECCHVICKSANKDDEYYEEGDLIIVEKCI